MAIDRLQQRLQNQNLDPNQRARMENRLAFEQRGGAGMQASQNRQAPPPQQPQPMQRPQPQQMPQQPMQRNPAQGMPLNGATNLGQFMSQQPMQANMGQMANRFANSYNQIQPWQAQGMGQAATQMDNGQPNQGVEAIRRYSPEESMAIRQQMQNRPQGGYQYQNPFPQQSQQMMPYNFKGNGNGLL